MANYSAIKAAVNGYIKRNGRKEITGNILNAVLNATIDSLGRYFQFAGGAMPTDDPGTPDQNVCYLAGEPGLYTHFGNIRIENEEVALLFWDGEWKKESVLIGIREVTADVDDQVGTPYVDVSFSQGRLVLTFHNLKGQAGNPGSPGESAGFGTIGADVTNSVGRPGVSVETSGSNTAKNIMFHFTNLKGDPGISSVVATIDDTSGLPSCQVSLIGSQLILAFSGLKGLKGDTGVSADYPITIYNGLDSDATDQALAAAQGKILDGKIGQLTKELHGFSGDKNVTPLMAQGHYYTVSGSVISVQNASTSWYNGDASTTPPTGGVDISDYAGKTIVVTVNNRGATSSRCCAILDESNAVVKSWKESEFTEDGTKYSYSVVVPSTGKWLFLSGGSTFTLDSVIVIGGEDIVGLNQRVAEVENDIQNISTDLETMDTEIQGVSDSVGEIENVLDGGFSPDEDVTPETATGYYYLASGSTIKIMAASSAHYSGTITDTTTPPTGGLDVSEYVGRRLKITVNNILATSTRLSAILDANMDVMRSREEQYFTADGEKYSTILNIPAGAKWFFFSGSSICTLDSVKILGEEEPGLVERVSSLETDSETKSLKVLLIGSSFGVNTIVQFPALAIAGGIECICGNLYSGGVTLHGIVNIINGNGNFQTGRIYTNETNGWVSASKNIATMIGAYDWDIVIIQRAAPNKVGGSDTWTSEMASDMETIIQYIASHATGSPKIMFNSVFGRSVGYFNGSREAEIASAELIMSTAKDMQDQFGLEVIPAAIAIQNARNTSLSYVTTSNTSQYAIPDLTGDGDHLDTGVGSYILGCLLYEQIIGKRFDKSILEMTTLPTIANVTNNGAFADSCFTQITPEQARIARYAAMCAVREPWTINEGLAERYPYPS